MGSFQMIITFSILALAQSSTVVVTHASQGGAGSTYSDRCSYDDNGKRFADDNYCYGYYECVYDKAEYRTCEDYYRYDSHSMKCVYDDTCKRVKDVVKADSYVPVQTSFGKTDKKCGYDDNGKRFADDHYCYGYYECVYDKAEYRTCEDYYRYDSHSMKCVYDDTCKRVKDVVKADSYVPVQTSFGKTDNRCLPEHHGKRYPDHLYCYGYYECVYDRAEYKTCVDYYRYDLFSMKCVYDETCRRVSGQVRQRNDNQCRYEDHGKRYSDFQYCYGYYECVYDQAEYRTCADYYRFDSYLMKCVYDDKCRRDSLQARTFIPRKDIQDSKQVRAFIPRKDSQCSHDDNGKRFADENNCYGYYECVFDKAEYRTCDDYNRFDPYLLKCVYSDQCRRVKDSKQVRAFIPRKDSQCSHDDNGKRFADENNCYGYYECVFDKAEYRTCDDYNRFDPYLLKCVYSDQCRRDSKQVRAFIPRKDSQCSYDDNGKRFADENYCYAYYECVYDKAEYRTCVDYYRFDPYLMKCVYDDKCRRDSKQVRPFIPRKDSCNVKPHSTDNTKFINNGYEFYCPPKHVFDVRDCTCVPKRDPKQFERRDPHQVVKPVEPKRPVKQVVSKKGRSCYGNDGKTFPIIGVCFAFFECVHGEEVYRQCEYGNSFDEYKGQCVYDDTCVTACPEQLKADPHDDRGYFLGGFKKQCPYGTFFDARICTCQHDALKPTFKSVGH